MTVDELNNMKAELLAEQEYLCVGYSIEAQQREVMNDPMPLKEIISELDTKKAIAEIENKFEEIMIFLVKNNIDFSTITLFNIDGFIGRAASKDELINIDEEKLSSLESKIADDVLPLSLYCKETADIEYNALSKNFDFLYGDLCVTALYTNFNTFISKMRSDDYELLLINPITNAIQPMEYYSFSWYLNQAAKGYQLAIRANFTEEQEITRKLINN